MTRLLVLAAALVAAASPNAFGKPECKAHPKAEWMKEFDARARLLEQGYQIQVFRVDGNCYEMVGTDKQGRKVEARYDTKTLELVKTETRR